MRELRLPVGWDEDDVVVESLIFPLWLCGAAFGGAVGVGEQSAARRPARAQKLPDEPPGSNAALSAGGRRDAAQPARLGVALSTAVTRLGEYREICGN